MTQPSRTTETINRDNAAIRDIMHQVRELTVPDRATLAVGLVGHLATMMNRSQMAKLMQQLQEEAERVQDVPPSRQRDDDDRDAQKDARTAEGARPAGPGKHHGDVLEEHVVESAGSGKDRAGSRESSADSRRGVGVGQAGRGEFRSGRLL
jgi:hypothetical protein